MTVEELLNVGTKERFFEIMNRMALSDRQAKIFELKYLRGWFSEDVAAEVDVSRSTVNADLKIIRHKLSQIEA